MVARIYGDSRCEFTGGEGNGWTERVELAGWGRKVGRDGVGWLGIALILGREGGVKRWNLGRWGEMVRR